MEGVEIAYVPIDCEGPVKPAKEGKPGKPEFLGTRVGVIIRHIGDQAVAVNCPFFDRDNSVCRNHGGAISQPVSCHRLDSVIERGYKFSQADVGRPAIVIAAADDPVYSIKEVTNADRVVLEMTAEPNDRVVMIRSNEFENVFISEEPLEDSQFLVLQVIRRKDGSIEFTVSQMGM